MTTRFIVLCTATILVLLSCGGAASEHKELRSPNAAFFLANNVDVNEALQSFAEVLCLQDKMIDDSPDAILDAGAECQDSRRNDDGDSLTHDGKWHDYVWLAYAGIVAMCAADEQLSNLCKDFR